jgi:polyether ionophore transport system permease protein
LFRVAFRQSWIGIVAVSAIGMVAGSIQAAAFETVAGTTAEARAAFGAQTTALARQIAYLLPLPVHPETLAGYVQWRVFGGMAIVILIWTVLSASGAGRGDEERGLVGTWLAAGMPRPRLLLWRVGVFVLGALLFGLLIGAASDAGAIAAGSSLPIGGLLGEAIAVAALGACCFAIVLVVAQLVETRRLAAGLGGALLTALFFLNGIARTVDYQGPAVWLSPFHYYDRSDALAPGGSVDWLAIAALIVVTAALVGLAALLFLGRDIGASALRRIAASRPPHYLPSANPLLRVPVIADLYIQRVGLLAWVASLAIFGLFMTSITGQVGEFIAKTPGMAPYAAAIGGSSGITRAVIGSVDYSITLALLAVYAVTMVARWAADDQEGRLELVLSEPVPRWRVVVERVAALAAGCVLIVLGVSVAVALVAPSQHVTLGAEDLFRAGAPLIPFGLLFGTLGATVAARFPRLAVGVLGGYVIAAYLVFQLAPFLGWPDWLLNLSVFNLYGNPLVTGIDWNGLWGVTAVAVAAFGAALLLMQRREVGS